MGESPRAGPTRRTDPTSAAAATAATPARTQHGGGQAGPNYSSGRAREVRSPPKAGSAAPPPRAAAAHFSPSLLQMLPHTYTPLLRCPGESRSRPALLRSRAMQRPGHRGGEKSPPDAAGYQGPSKGPRPGRGFEWSCRLSFSETRLCPAWSGRRA